MFPAMQMFTQTKPRITPVVTPAATNIGRTAAPPGDCYAGIVFNTDGTEYSNDTNGGTTYDVSRGNWLDSGDSYNVWVERTLDVGGLNSVDPGAGRLRMTVNRKYEIVEYSNSKTSTVTFDFYDAESGGTLLATQQIVFLAETDL